MKKEKNEWIDKYIPYICNEDRIIFSKENVEYSNENSDIVKAEYLSNVSVNSNIIMFIDDDVRNLIKVQKLGKNNIIPIHVTSVLI